MTAPSPAVTYNFSDWIGAFPEFTNVGDVLGQTYFNRATNIFANTIINPAYCGLGSQGFQTALYLLVSHVAWLNAPRDASGNPAATGQPASPIVGRINTASEGSVSVGADMGDANAGSPSQAYFMQTKYGAEFWTTMAPFRTAVPVNNPQFMPLTGFPGWIGGFRGRGFR